MKHKIIILLFLSLLLLPAICFLFSKPTNLISKNENRVLTKFPGVPKHWAEVKEWPTQFNAFVNDQLPGRNKFIQSYNTLIFELGIERHERITYGQNGWMYNNAEENLNQKKGLEIFSDETVQSFADNLKHHQSFFKEQMGIPFYCFIAPDKGHVYPDFLPKHMARFDNKNLNYDNTKKALFEKGVNYIEVPEYLISKLDKNNLLYQKTSAHWNTLGAYYAYERLMPEFKKDFPDLTTLKFEDLKPTTKNIKQDFHYSIGGYIAGSLTEPETLYNVPNNETTTYWFTNEGTAMEWKIGDPRRARMYQLQISVVETSNKNAPVLLAIRDSYVNTLAPYLESSFSKIIYVHHLFGTWNPKILQQFKPDAVLMQVAERNLGKFEETPDFSQIVPIQVEEPITTTINRSIKDRIELLRKQNSPTHQAIYNINKQKAVNKNWTFSKKDSLLNIIGIAVDEKQKLSAAQVYLQIGDQYFTSEYGLPTKAYAEAKGNSNYQKVGYTAKIDMDRLSPGIHKIRVIIVANNNLYCYLVNHPNTITITN